MVYRIWKKKASLALFASLILFIFLEVTRLLSDGSPFGFRGYYKGSIIEPAEILMIFFLVVGLFMLAFNNKIQHLWWRWFRFTLIFPVIPIVLFFNQRGGGGGYVGIGGTTEIITLWAFVIVVITIIYTFYHRLYLKTGV